MASISIIKDCLSAIIRERGIALNFSEFMKSWHELMKSLDGQIGIPTEMGYLVRVVIIQKKSLYLRLVAVPFRLDKSFFTVESPSLIRLHTPTTPSVVSHPNK